MGILASLLASRNAPLRDMSGVSGSAGKAQVGFFCDEPGQLAFSPNGSTHPVGLGTYWYALIPPASFTGSGVKYRPTSGL